MPTSEQKIRFLFICAFECEARPIIDYFHLKIYREHPFKIWKNESYVLVVSGLGKRSISEATAYCSGHFEKLEAFLNVGVAGHKEEKIGKGFLAHQISDASTGEKYYPVILFKPPVPSISLITVDKLEKTFSTSSLYEMEASSFFATASRFTTFELIQCFKVVSDNAQKPFSVHQQEVSTFIKAHCSSIEQIANEMLSLLNQLPLSVEEDLKKICSSFHFTLSERHLCKRLLERCKALHIPLSDLEGCQSAKDVLDVLQSEIKKYV